MKPLSPDVRVNAACFAILLSVTLFATGLSAAAPPCPGANDAIGSTGLMLPLAAEGGASNDGTGEAGQPQGGWAHFVDWIGHFHPPLTAFPIAMLLGAAVAEALRLLGGPPWLEGGSRWCVIVGALGAAITAPLGWAFAVNHGRTWVLEVHRWLGTAAGCGAVAILILSELGRRRRGGWLTLYRTVLFIAVPLVVATGFFGGAMVYGIHAYDWSSPR
jgi:uncharacterized membrane protein